MGLTHDSIKKNSLKDLFNIDKNDNQYVVALAGNPNTGKSTVFNSLTGLHQHTGNWPGKTVVNARGQFKHKGEEFVLVDLPGTYSLFASSEEEVVARDFVCFGNPDAVIVVTDATCLERNLNLVFQVMELTDNVILCINLIDEAEKKGIKIDKKGIEKELGIPVVLTSALNNVGLDKLKNKVYEISQGKSNNNTNHIHYSEEIEELINNTRIDIDLNLYGLKKRWMGLRIIDSDKSMLSSMKNYMNIDDYQNLLDIYNITNKIDRNKTRELINEKNYEKAEEISTKYTKGTEGVNNRDIKIDNIITSRKFGIPIMLLLLGTVFWITIQGANVPSQMLAKLLFGIEERLTLLFMNLNAPEWLHGVLVLGLYRTLAWVVSVMLPPMAIFFPMFTLLEDCGYLPRVAFNMDHLFKKACAHGKQCLTMCMGFGCNAAGIIGCRIIESPREKLIAIVTNNFVPCNGRFPTIIAISSVFFALYSNKYLNSMIPALWITLLVLIGILTTLAISYLLSKTLLKGVPSTFTLELPPYRRPKVGRVIYTSIIDRTIFVLSRAILIAAPAGAITWLLANLYIGDYSIITHIANTLEPVANLIGLDGIILMAFIIGLPANEIVLPVLLMAYLSTGSLIEFDSIESLREILLTNGWNSLTAINTMLFSLLHWPCSTALWTIKKETGSWKWTVISALIPTVTAFVVCLVTASIYRLIF